MTWDDVWDILLDFYSPLEAHEWMASPQKLLNGRKPAECTPDECYRILSPMRDGNF